MSKKILIVGPAWVGDMVMAQVLFKHLKCLDPGTQIDVLAPAWTHPLLARMPEVNAAIISPFRHGEWHFRQRRQLGLALRQKNYDQAIVLPNSFKSALIPFWARIPRRTGWSRELRYGLLNDVRALDKKRYPLMIERFLALGLNKNDSLPAQYDYPQLVVSTESIHKSLQAQDLSYPDQPILALCPGAEFGPAKQWPLDYYAAVANAKLDAGYQVWIFGSAKDKPAAASINQLTQDRCKDLAGSTSLDEAVDLLSLANLVITNDSGLMHVAAALQRKVIALYGSSSPDFTPPLSEQAHILRLSLDCSPCFKRECPLGHFRCMKELTPDKVLKNLVQ